MFKYASKFIRLLTEKEALKNVQFRTEKTGSKQYFKRSNFNPPVRNYFAHTNHSQRVGYEKPVIILGGIMSFLGFGEKPPEESELIMSIKRGILYMQREQYEKSEEALHHALKLAIEENDEEGITYVNDILANLYFETGHYAKARKLFLNVIQKIIAKGEDVTSNKFIHISLKLAKTYEDAKEYRHAEQGYKYCIEALDKRLADNEEADEDTLALWGMSMDWYARFLLNINRKEESLKCFKKAYEMCVKVNGVDHEQTVILLNDLGTVASLIGDTESAMNYFEEAKEIGKKLPEMRDLAAIYINLGQLYMLREMYRESQASCLEGLRRAKAHKDEAAFSEAKQCLQEIKRAMKTPSGVKVVASKN